MFGKEFISEEKPKLDRSSKSREYIGDYTQFPDEEVKKKVPVWMSNFSNYLINKHRDIITENRKKCHGLLMSNKKNEIQFQKKKRNARDQDIVVVAQEISPKAVTALKQKLNRSR